MNSFKTSVLPALLFASLLFSAVPASAEDTAVQGKNPRFVKELKATFRNDQKDTEIKKLPGQEPSQLKVVVEQVPEASK